MTDFYRVEARTETGTWMVWCSWVDRFTAEGEKNFAEEQGYRVRILRETDESVVPHIGSER